MSRLKEMCPVGDEAACERLGNKADRYGAERTEGVADHVIDLVARRRRILVNSHVFSPSVGGSESACLLLVEGLLRYGYEVKVVTETPCNQLEQGPFTIFRQPARTQLFDLVRWADVVVHSNISLRAAWPLLFAPKPWVIIHHSSLARSDGRRTWQDWLKLGAALLATNIAVSEAMASTLLTRSFVLGNGYRDQVFRQIPSIKRVSNLIFVGRLVSSKGVDLAIRALVKLRQEGFSIGLTVVGDGPCKESLCTLVRSLGLGNVVRFLGNRSPDEIAELLNQHRVLVVPSKGVETFGLVAIEALACGCVPVVSAVGGLPETVGNHGVVVPEEDLDGFVSGVRELLQNPHEVIRRLEGVDAHLERFREGRVIKAYVDVIERACKRCKVLGLMANAGLPLVGFGQSLLAL